MNKDEVLGQLKNAQLAHIEWVNKAKSLVNGKDARENLVPVSIKESQFGKWFYKEGQLLNALSNNPLSCMKNIDRLHNKAHGVYFDIFSRYFPLNVEEGMFSKFFAKKRKALLEDEQEQVALQLAKLEALVQELIDELSRLERRIEAVSQEKLETLV